jgi:DNA-binding CsgD family transcriptional regulator
VAYRFDTDVEDRVELHGVVAEFRDALEAEARAVRAGSGGNAVVLRQGRRILHGAGLHHYAFQVDFPQRLPVDAPAKLVIEGRAAVDVIVAEVKGLSVTVVSPEDLGQTIAGASLQTDMSFLLERLIKRLEEAAGEPNEIGDRILGAISPRARRSDAPVSARYALLPEQETALRQALGGDVFIWGPPGTGKTQTIGAIVSELLRAGRSVLLVSHTNSAVDGGLERAVRNLGLLAEDGPGFEEGDLVRVGVCKDRRLQYDADAGRPSVLARSIARRRSAEWEQELASIEQTAAKGHRRVSQLRRLIDLDEFYRHARPELAGFRGRVDQAEATAQQADETAERLAAARTDLAPLQRQLQAVERSRAAETEVARLERDLASERQALSERNAERVTLEAELADAVEILGRAEESGGLTRIYRRLPKPAEQRDAVAAVRLRLGEAERSEADAQRACAATSERLRVQREEIDRASSLFAPAGPDDVSRRTTDGRARVAQLEAEHAHLRSEHADIDRPLRGELQERLTVLAEEALARPVAAGTELRVQLDALEGCVERVGAELEGFDAAAARSEIAELERSIAEGRVRAEELRELIARAEEQVIADARLVATTLTGAYLRDAIVARTFDVVILDEASMAPIPSLFFAAGLATGSAVVVGDFRQLPPIVISEDEIAQRWLGRDIFEVADVAKYEHADQPPPWFVMLREQKRMRPQISRVVNRFIYGGKLRDGGLATLDEPWLAADWPHRDERVLLVDLSKSGAWVSRVPSGRHSSKVNFYSATVCVELAGALLGERHAADEQLDTASVAIISRYRPHASLCELLVEHRGLVPDVQAGTAHSFQGGEAQTVIVDVVDAPPVWKSGLLRPDEDNDQNQRLLNVAITRAKQRLILVGHFDWVRKNGRHSFLHKLIADLADRHPVVPVEELIPDALHARVAATRGLIVGEREADGEHVIADEVAYYDLLRRDLATARELVAIFSPFLTARRLLDLQADLRATQQRGVKLVVVTKPPSERGQQQQVHRDAEALLRDWGAAVLHKLNAHEKLVFVDPFDRDAALCWHGSLNTLSQRESGELMTRERHPVVGRYAEIMGLRDLLDLALDPSPSIRMCPVCQDHPLMAVESGKTPPFLWRCEDTDHYWRRKDDTPPRDGKIICRTCGGALEYHQTDKGHYWRCTDNHRHRISVHRDHLRLPAMRALIPRRDLIALERAWKLPPSPRPTKLTLEATNGDPAAPTNLDDVALAPRELDVLRLMAREGSYSDIADELGLQLETVKGYAKAVRRKLGASSRDEAVARARTAGLML